MPSDEYCHSALRGERRSCGVCLPLELAQTVEATALACKAGRPVSVYTQKHYMHLYGGGTLKSGALCTKWSPHDPISDLIIISTAVVLLNGESMRLTIQTPLTTLPSPLTHGLVFGADGGGVVEDENVSLKLPAGHGAHTGVHHHHTLADLVALDLQDYKRLQKITREYTKVTACVYYLPPQLSSFITETMILVDSYLILHISTV